MFESSVSEVDETVQLSVAENIASNDAMSGAFPVPSQSTVVFAGTVNDGGV